MVIWTFPDDVSEAAQALFVRATGNFKIHFADDWRGVQGRAGKGQECADQLHPTNINQAITGSKAKTKTGRQYKQPPLALNLKEARADRPANAGLTGKMSQGLCLSDHLSHRVATGFEDD
jgi:hypothetical protein